MIQEKVRKYRERARECREAAQRAKKEERKRQLRQAEMNSIVLANRAELLVWSDLPHSGLRASEGDGGAGRGLGCQRLVRLSLDFDVGASEETRYQQLSLQPTLRRGRRVVIPSRRALTRRMD
jgi:hypothetical protein